MVTVFPANPLGIKLELWVAGVWTDISAYLYERDPVQIQNMGRVDENGVIQASQMTLTLNNRDFRFTPKNASGAYFPAITVNALVRVSVTGSESSTLVAYTGFRFCGEVMSWPPASDSTGIDATVSIVAVGIWTRISQSSTTIGSSYTRYVNQLTGTNIPAGHWTMEDGSGSLAFVKNIGAGGNASVTAGTPSYAADGTSFAGADALMQFNNARITCPVSGGGTPTNNVIRFALSVPSGGDGNQQNTNWNLVEVDTTGTVKKIEVYMLANGKLQFDGVNVGGTVVFTTSTTTNVRAIPLLVSMELTPSGANITWTLNIIKPGAGSVLETKTGTLTTASINTVTSVKLNRAGMLTNTTFGQLSVNYTVPSIVTAAAALGGHAGEFAVDRFTRLCTEFGITSTIIGSTSAAMGPQVDDTLSNLLQGIENTDGGLLYEPRDSFGLGYRTLLSLQNQSVAVTLNYANSPISPPFPATYDTQLLKNQWTVNNWDGYSTVATLTSGSRSVQGVPNGAGLYAGGPLDVVANVHAQADAIAQQRLFQGATDEVRYPQLNLDLHRSELAAFFASVPGLRIGDYVQVTNLPAFHGVSTAKLLMWGYQETLTNFMWTISFNAIPESPLETTFNPGVFSVTQAPQGSVAQGSSIGSSVSGSQIGSGSVPATALSNVISAKSLGGITYFTGAPTPYGWTFAVIGVPADVGYFICTEDQAVAIVVGDSFVNTGGLGGPFTVTSLDPPSGGNVNVHFQPDASGVMSSGTVNGATNGDEWINSSGGNQINKWVNGAWVPITFNATNVIVAGSITATQIAALTITAGLLVAGIVVSGIVDATVVQAATFLAVGTSGEFLAYSGTPSAINLIASISGMAGTDAFSTPYAGGVEVHIGGLVLDNQSGSPGATSGASTFYSSVLGRPRYISSVGDDSALERSQVSQSNVTMTTQTIATAISQPLTVQSGEANVGSEFEIEIMGQIVPPTGGGSFVLNASGPLYTVQIMINGSVLGGVVGWGGVYLLQGTTYTFNVTCRCSIEATGAGGTCTLSTWGTIQQQGPNVGNLMTGSSVFMSQGFSTVGTGKAIDTTTTNTLKIFGFWGSVVGLTGHHVTTYRTKTGRRM